MKLYLIIAFVFVSATGYTQERAKEILSGKPSALPSKENFFDDWASLTKYQQENKELPNTSQRRE